MTSSGWSAISMLAGVLLGFGLRGLLSSEAGGSKIGGASLLDPASPPDAAAAQCVRSEVDARELRQARHALLWLRRGSGAVLEPWPTDLDPKYTSDRVEVALDEALQACPSTSDVWNFEVDCSEYPCMVWLRTDPNSLFPSLPSCPSWSASYALNSVTTMQLGDVALSVLPIYPEGEAPSDWTAKSARRIETARDSMLKRFNP